jgi:hypothetical protein
MKSIIKMLMALVALILFMTGCKYEVAEPPWEQDFVNPPTPVITEIQPANVAPAGINTITILGENFAETVEDNKVYFDNVNAEIITASTNSITVYRPNLVSDSSTIWVVSYNAIVTAKYAPYKIDRVMDRYGEFRDNNQLGAIAVDQDENMYAIEISTVYKITPDGEKIFIGQTEGNAYDARIGPSEELVILMNSTVISQMDVATGEVTKWAEVAKRVRYGDFDAQGNFYTSGRKAGLYIVAQGDTVGESVTIAGVTNVYLNDIIYYVRVYHDNHTGKEYIYLLVELSDPDENNPELAIWRHEILDANGNLGERELVLDWSTTGEFAETNPISFAIHEDEDGVVIYVGTDHTDPILMFDPDKNSQNILYKGILPSSAQKLEWGNTNYLYMILGGDENNVLRIDMGNE